MLFLDIGAGPKRGRVFVQRVFLKKWEDGGGDQYSSSLVIIGMVYVYSTDI
jgi:hypothetical protein